MMTTIDPLVQLVLDSAVFEIGAEPDLDVAPEDCFASGDEEWDRATVRGIRDRIGRDDPWAWALVTVTARLQVPAFGGTMLEGWDALGGCSYLSEAEFRTDVYYEDMRRQAARDLVERTHAAAIEADATWEALQRLSWKE